jgi:hypothetical protein
MALTVGDALAAFRQIHGLVDDEAGQRTWTCRLGPLTLRFSNWRWRRRAILAHDLHHLLTGIPCSMRGEFQMAAWEFGAGPMPHCAATLFCLPLVLIGLFWKPRRIWLAFLAGRRSHTLHSARSVDALLAMPLAVARRPIANDTRASLSDRARFAVLVVAAGCIVLSPLAIVLGAVAAHGGALGFLQ